MDFWDVLKLMLRRWLVVLPMLLLTIGATVWTAVAVKPDYKATGHVTVLPPSVRQDSPQAGKKQTVNPWTEEALAEAVMIRLQRKDLHDKLAADGYRGEWETAADGLQPVITIEVIAPSPAEAQRTISRLIDVLDQEVKDRQAPYKLPAGENITTVTLDGGDTIDTVTSKLKRALVVVMGVGLILTVMVAVGVDAILRRRARTRMLKVEANAAALQARLEGRVRAVNGTDRAPAGTLAQPGMLAPPGTLAPAGTLVRSAAAEIEDTEQTRPVVLLGAPNANGPNANAKRDLDKKDGKPSPRPTDANSAVTTTIINAVVSNGAPSTGDGVSGSGAGPGAGPGAGKRTEHAPLPEDATIVLPLSNAPWSANAGPGRNSSGNEAKKH
jgi:capsular polysaccharide biosynthesis protein